MENPKETVQVDLSNLYAIAGGDDSFVAALLMKMCAALPVAFTTMKTAVGEQDWSALKSAAHKAKSTFAYLGQEEMRDMLKNIEHDAMEGTNLDSLPERVDQSVELGEKIHAGLEAKLAELS